MKHQPCRVLANSQLTKRLITVVPRIVEKGLHGQGYLPQSGCQAILRPTCPPSEEKELESGLLEMIFSPSLSDMLGVETGLCLFLEERDPLNPIYIIPFSCVHKSTP